MPRSAISTVSVLLAIFFAGPGIATAQAPWAMTPPAQTAAGNTLPWFPFGTPQPRQETRPAAPVLPFPWLGGNAQGNPALSWGSPSAGFTPSMPSMGYAPFGSQAFAGNGAMGMMTAPMMSGMMGFMAPMMTNYAIASMNPTTMTNFFGMMTNPGGGMMPFGGFGFPGGSYGAGAPFSAPGTAYPNPSPQSFPLPWMQPQAQGQRGYAGNANPTFPPFFPFFNQGRQSQ